MEQLSKFAITHFRKLLLSIVVFSVLIFAIPIFFSDNHFLYNLEPYPDGLFYTLSAKNLFENQRLSLVYQGTETYISQPPLYAFILTFGYLIWNNPASFYIINTLLLFSTFLILYKIIINQDISKISKLLSVLFFVSHGYFYLLLSLPMTENISLFLLTLGVYKLLKKSFTKMDFFHVTLISILLVLSRLSIVPTAGTLILIGIYRLTPSLDKIEKHLYLIATFIGIIILNYSFLFFLNRSLFEYFIYFFQESFLSANQHSFYSSKFILNNLESYSSMLLGFKTNFLWFTYPLTSISFVIILVINLIKATKKKINKIIPLLFIISSIFSLLITFYLADARYIIYAIPILGIIISMTFPKKIDTKYIILLFFLFCLHIYSQIPIFKQLISDNIFHRSTAWQYEAVKVIDAFKEKNPNASLITALPPHLVDAYSDNAQNLLPLSQDQEFLQKNQFVWGNNIYYDDLIKNTEEYLNQNKEIYITNSYITHQASVIEDYEQYKNKFGFELVETGCLDACNIYKLSLKENVE